MGDQPHTYLTTKDYMVLETMLDRSCESSGPYRALLERKVRSALVSLREDVAEDVVTLNTRLRYRVDGSPFGPQLLVQSPDADLPDFAVSIHGLRGLALLGLKEGDTIAFGSGDGTTSQVQVDEILSQPEADARRREMAVLAPRPATGPTPNVVPLRRPRAPLAVVVDDDDPGPFAA